MKLARKRGADIVAGDVIISGRNGEVWTVERVGRACVQTFANREEVLQGNLVTLRDSQGVTVEDVTLFSDSEYQVIA